MSNERTKAVDFAVDVISRKRWQCVGPLLALSSCSYLGALLALSSSSPALSAPVWGNVNLAYFIAISQFGMTFLVAIVYTLWTNACVDPLSECAHGDLRSLANSRSSVSTEPPTLPMLSLQGDVR